MKVRVNRVRGGSMGDQRNYGLVTGSIWNYENKPSTNNVSDTLGPVDRDEATIEAERGETVVYPDKDGQITHAKIGGKRHTNGGTPLDVPDGAFVYSDTKSLLIKNQEMLKNIFGMNSRKAVTPAKVASRYDLNKYNEILNDPLADPLDKRTAQLMLDNNLRKLGQVALVQEGMKGFPDGIPDIALPLFAVDIAAEGQPQQMPQAKFGGQIMRKGGRLKSLKRFQGTDDSQPGFYQQGPYEEVYDFDKSNDASTVINGVLFDNPSVVRKQYVKDESGKYVIDPQTGEPMTMPVYSLSPIEVTEYASPRGVINAPLVTNLPAEDSDQYPGVKMAADLYNEAVQSGDPVKMKKAMDLIKEIDVKNSWGLGLKAFDQWRLEFGEDVGNWFRDAFGLGKKSFENDFLRGMRFNPVGVTWEEKVNDMARELNALSSAIEKNKTSAKSLETGYRNWQDWRNKFSQTEARAREILANPSAPGVTPGQLNAAQEFIQKVDQTGNWTDTRLNNAFRSITDPRIAMTNQRIDPNTGEEYEVINPYRGIYTYPGTVYDYPGAVNELVQMTDKDYKFNKRISPYAGIFDEVSQSTQTAYDALFPEASKQKTEESNAKAKQTVADVASQFAMDSNEFAPADSASGPVMLRNVPTTPATPQNQNTPAPAAKVAKGTPFTDQDIVDYYRDKYGMTITTDSITPDMRRNLKQLGKDASGKIIKIKERGGSIIMFDPVENKILPKMQTDGQFDIFDKPTRDWAQGKKLKVVTPSWWNKSYQEVGTQNPGRDDDYVYTAEGTIVPKTGISGYGGIDDLIKYHEDNGVDFSQYPDQNGNVPTGQTKDQGKARWKADISKSAKWDANQGKYTSAGNTGWAQHQKAAGWLLDTGEELNRKLAASLGYNDYVSQLDKQKHPSSWNRIGTDVITGYKYLGKEDTPATKYICKDGVAVPSTDGTGYDTEAEALQNCPKTPPGKTYKCVNGKVIEMTDGSGTTLAEAEKECMVVKKPEYKNKPYAGPWPDYAQVAYATAKGLQLDPGDEPGLFRYKPRVYDPVPRDVRAFVAQTQAPVAAMAPELAGTPQGRANLIAASAQTQDPIAKYMADVENYNSGLFTAANKDNAATQNEGDLRNISLMDKYLKEKAELRQQRTNDFNKKMLAVADAYGKGAMAYRNDQGLRMKFPNYQIDMFGNALFDGSAYNPNLTADSDASEKAWNKYYVEQGLTPLDAAKMAATRTKMVGNNQSPYTYNPMNAIWNSYNDDSL